jgi:hypothetical protein
VIAMKRSFIGVLRYIAFRSPSGRGGRALYAEAKARVNPGEGFRESAMEDVSSFGREMIFHHRTGPFRSNVAAHEVGTASTQSVANFRSLGKVTPEEVFGLIDGDGSR